MSKNSPPTHVTALRLAVCMPEAVNGPQDEQSALQVIEFKRLCLADRLWRPEVYTRFEDVRERTSDLICWLIDNDPGYYDWRDNLHAQLVELEESGAPPNCILTLLDPPASSDHSPFDT